MSFLCLVSETVFYDILCDGDSGGFYHFLSQISDLHDGVPTRELSEVILKLVSCELNHFCQFLHCFFAHSYLLHINLLKINSGQNIKILKQNSLNLLK